MYLDYETYVSMDGDVVEAAFPRLSYLAGKKIDRYTQNRVQAMRAVPEAVQRCMAELINAMGQSDPTETASTAPLSGFSNDGYSESYAKPLTAESLESALYGIICDYLASESDDNGTPLLYLGVDA